MNIWNPEVHANGKPDAVAPILDGLLRTPLFHFLEMNRKNPLRHTDKPRCAKLHNWKPPKPTDDFLTCMDCGRRLSLSSLEDAEKCRQ